MASKRGNGEGSFRQLPNGRWQGRISFKDQVTGKYRSVSKYGTTRAEAQRKIEEVRSRLRAGKPATDSADTVGRWCQHWAATVLPATRLRESTQISYRSVTERRILNTKIADLPLAKLEPSDIDQWILELRAGGFAPATLRRAYNVLARILEAAVRDGLLATNPIRRVDRPSAGRSTPKVLTPDEVRNVLQAASGHWMFPLIQFFAATGVRRGEALGLMWGAIDFNTGRVDIATSLGRTENGMDITELKTGSSRRTVLVPPAVLETLRTLRTAQQHQRLTAPVWHDIGVVFSRADGRPLSVDTATRHFQSLCRQAGVVRKVGFHAIRHEAATKMLDAGVNPKVVADWFGHSTTRTTLDTYSHTSAATQELAANALWGNVIDAADRFGERSEEAV